MQEDKDVAPNFMFDKLKFSKVSKCQCNYLAVVHYFFPHCYILYAYTFRCTTTKLFKFVSRIDETKKAPIKEIGFSGLLEIQCHIILKDIYTWLVNNFNSTHSYIQLEDGRVLLVTLEDVAKDLEISREGLVPMKNAGNGGAESDSQYSRKKKYN